MKSRKILGVLLLIISFALIGSGTFLMINGNKIRFVNAIKKATSNIVEDVDTFKEIFVLAEYDASKTNTKVSSTNTLTFRGESVVLAGDIYTKANSKKDFYYDFALKSGSDTVSLAVLLKESKAYANIKEVSDKFYYFDFDLLDNANELNEEDFEVLKDYLLDSTFKILAKNAIFKEKTDIMLGGSTYKLDKLTIDVSEKNLNEILIDFLKKVNDNPKYKKVMNSETVDEVSIDDSIKAAEEALAKSADKILFTYSVYVDSKDRIFRHELTDESKEKIVINSYEDKSGRKQFLFEVSKEGKSIVSFEIKGIDDTQSIITGIIDGSPVISGTYTRTDKLIELALSLNMSEGSVKLTYKFESVEKNKKYKQYLEIDVMSMIVLESDNEVELGVEYPNIDVSNSYKFEELTPEDGEKLMELIIVNLELLQGLLGIVPDMM